MADGVKIEIVSPERLVVSQQAQSVTVPGAEGYFTVVGEHAPPELHDALHYFIGGLAYA